MSLNCIYTKNNPFVLSLSKHERQNNTPFDMPFLSKPFTLREPQGERLSSECPEHVEGGAQGKRWEICLFNYGLISISGAFHSPSHIPQLNG
jgi:hypothetical protein